MSVTSITITPAAQALLAITASELEARFLLFWFARDRGLGLPDPTLGFRFDPTRKWLADFAWVDARVLVEIEGGAMGKSRHKSNLGYQADLAKYNRAALLGYTLLRYTGSMIDATAIEQVVELVGGRLLGLKTLDESEAP